MKANGTTDTLTIAPDHSSMTLAQVKTKLSIGSCVLHERENHPQGYELPIDTACRLYEQQTGIQTTPAFWQEVFISRSATAKRVHFKKAPY